MSRNSEHGLGNARLNDQTAAGERTHVAVVTPTISASGGTERLLQNQLASIHENVVFHWIVPRNLRPPWPGPIYPVSVLPVPEPARTLLWFRAATARLNALPEYVRIRYSPGVNALGVTHTTMHAIFGHLSALASQIRTGSAREWLRRFRYDRIARWEERLLARNPRVATVSPLAAEWLATRYSCSPSVHLPVLDIERYSPKRRAHLRHQMRSAYNVPEDRHIVLAVGNSWLVKGWDILLDAWRRAGLVEAELWLVSSEDRRHAKWMLGPIPPNVRWLGFVENLDAHYAAADLLVQPSRGESFGLPVVEAGGMGVPVRVSRHAGAAAVVDAGSVVPDLFSDSWAAVLQNALSGRPGRCDERLLGTLRGELPAQEGSRFLHWLLGD